MKRKPQLVSVERFPEQIRHFIELDRKVMYHLFDHRNEPLDQVVQNDDFLLKCSDAYVEECGSWARDITFGDFVLESIETYTFRKN